MDERTFDGLTRTLAIGSISRRRVLCGLGGGTLAALLARFGQEAEAAKCVKPGKKCKSKKGKKKCCGGAKCRGNRCKCVGGSQACGKKCCPKTAICQGNTCLSCDVCPNGCAFTKVQDAVDAAGAGGTVVVCPGSYTGKVTVNKDLTLVGAGANRTSLSGGGVTQVLFIGGGTTVLVQDLEITEGDGVSGAGVGTDGALTLQRVSVTKNTAGTVGGGIYVSNSGNLNLIASSVTKNIANNGGGLFNEGIATIPSGNSVSLNKSNTNGAGIYNFFGVLTIGAGNVVTANKATNNGGGIFRQGGNVTVESNSVTDNNPNNCGGDAVANCIG